MRNGRLQGDPGSPVLRPSAAPVRRNVQPPHAFAVALVLGEPLALIGAVPEVVAFALLRAERQHDDRVRTAVTAARVRSGHAFNSRDGTEVRTRILLPVTLDGTSGATLIKLERARHGGQRLAGKPCTGWRTGVEAPPDDAVA